MSSTIKKPHGWAVLAAALFYPMAAGAQAPKPAPALDPSETTTSFVERLPSTAYPDWQVRGIPGGSLAGTFHGMPWPYFPKTGLGISGNLWVDTGYEFVQRGKAGADTNSKLLVSQGRGVLRLTPTYSVGAYFVQGQVEVVGNKDQSVAQPKVVDLDDLWIRAGQWKKWDVQLGRFEAFEVYHFGMGMDLNTLERTGAYSDLSRSPPDVFELGGTANIAYRQSGPTNVALHVYPGDHLRLEMLGQLGYDSAAGIDTLGVRPAAVLDFGVVKLKAAADLRRQFQSAVSSKELRTLKGGVGAIQFVLPPFVEGGLNLAYGSTTHYAAQNTTDPNAPRGDYDAGGSLTDLDYGGFLNVAPSQRFVLGGGVNYNQELDKKSGAFTHLQTFAAAQYRAADGLFLKLVVSYAKGHLAPGGEDPWDNTMKSARLRVQYLF